MHVATAKEPLVVRIVPMGGSGKRVALETFVAELQAIHGALARTDRLTTGKPTLRFEVVELSMNSPARVSIVPQLLDRKVLPKKDVIGNFVSGLQSIRKGEPPDDFDRPMLEKVREIAFGVSKRRVRTELIHGAEIVIINHIFEKKIAEILNRTEKEFGTIEGRMEGLNIHANNNICSIYPVRGAKKITCHFPVDLKEKIINSVDQFVLVEGFIEYGFRSEYPHRIDAKNLEVVSSTEMPHFEEMRGMAREVYDEDLDSTDIIDQVRNGWR